MEILRLILNLNGVISPIDELGFTWLTEKKQKINSDKIQFSQPYAFWFFSGLRQWWTHRNLHYHSKVFNVRFKGFAFQHPFFLIRTQASFYLLAHFFCSPLSQRVMTSMSALTCRHPAARKLGERKGLHCVVLFPQQDRRTAFSGFRQFCAELVSASGRCFGCPFLWTDPQCFAIWL